MQLFTLQEIDTAKRPLIRCRQSLLFCLIPLILVSGLIAGLVCWYSFGNAPLNPVLGACGVLSLIAFFAVAEVKKALLPSNWILTIEPNQIWIKFRSYLNPHFPSTNPQVVRLDLEEIKSACITKQRLTQYSVSGSRRTSFHTFLDLTIAKQDLSLLEEQLRYERNVKPPLTGKFIKSSSKRNHYPVSVIDHRVIRIEWRSPSDWIAPRITKATQLLGNMDIQIEPLKNEVVDMTNSGGSQKDMEDKILCMAERGNAL